MVNIDEQQQSINRIFSVIAGLVVFAAAFALMAYIQFNPNNPYLSEFDSYYHVKMAELIRDRGFDFSNGIFGGLASAGPAAIFQILGLGALFGITWLLSKKNKKRNAIIITVIGAAILILNSIFIQHFPWLYYTTLNEDYVNHHLLFHITMIPFIQLFGIFAGAKIYMIIATALCFVFFYLILRDQKVPGALFWALLAVFTMSSDFYYRLNFIKAIALSLCFMAGTMYFSFRGKELLVAILSFLYVWSYGGFTFLPIFAVVYLVCQLLCREEVNWKVTVGILGGTTLGLIMNPYFPKNIEFLFLQIFQTGLGAQGYVGGEWAPYDSFFWLTINIVPVVIFLMGIGLAFFGREKKNAKTLSILLMSFLFLFLVWKSKRFVEYSPFFLTLSGIMLMKETLEQKLGEIRDFFSSRQSTAQRETAAPATVFEKQRVLRYAENGVYILIALVLFSPLSIAHIGGEKEPARLENNQVVAPHKACTGIAIPPQVFEFAYCQITRAYNDTQTLFSMSALLKVHNYLLEKANEGDIVFTDDWDVFPRYFFANSKTYYLVGLDPEFMNQYEGEPYPGEPGKLYQEFASISSGNDSNNLERIKNDFKAKWVIVNVDHGQFYQNLKRNPQLFEEIMFAANDPTLDKNQYAQGDGYYLFKVL